MGRLKNYYHNEIVKNMSKDYDHQHKMYVEEQQYKSFFKQSKLLQWKQKAKLQLKKLRFLFTFTITNYSKKKNLF